MGNGRRLKPTFRSPPAPLIQALAFGLRPRFAGAALSRD